MRLATRAAARAIGQVEPNPAVGCVIAAPDGDVLAIGHHRRFGGPHAEIEALARCRALGRDPRGATMVVTLEPCNHHGKTGPCSEAVVSAGIARVVYARPDPNPPASGGAARLAAAGVEVSMLSTVPEARDLSAAFCKRVTTGLPWVIAKWAQTVDGFLATRSGSSQWISGERSRRRVHRLRGRVDAILTGVGTVLRDDPRLTARDVTVRRTARRVVVDSHLRSPMSASIFRGVQEAPVTVITTAESIARHADRASAMREGGAEVVGVPATAEGRVNLELAMRLLVERHDVLSVLVESGPGVISGLLAADLIDEAHAYIAPMVLGDPQGLSIVDLGGPRDLAESVRFDLRSMKRCGDDVRLRYIRAGR